MKFLPMVLLGSTLIACAPMTGRSNVARTMPPEGGARSSWCEAQVSQEIVACGAPSRRTAIPGDRCMCFVPQSDEVVYGRVVIPPTGDEWSTASRAFVDEGSED